MGHQRGDARHAPVSRSSTSGLLAGPTPRRYCVFANVGTTCGGYAMGTEGFNHAVAAWITAYATHWRAIGLDPGRVGLLLVDEPHATDQSDRIVAWATAIKAAEPGVLIWEDPTWSNPSDGAATFAVSDVLCPNRPMFLNGGESFRDVYRQQRDAGKTLNLYSCSGPTEQLDPYSYYRLQAWTLWDEWGRVRDEPAAMFYWAFPDQGGAASWKSNYGTRNNYTPLFLEPGAVTDGKDMEAIREGVEDYEYLAMLKRRIAELEALGVSPSTLADAQSLLAGAATSVLGASAATGIYWNQAKDRAVADGVRDQVLDMLESLAQAALPTVGSSAIRVEGATGTGGIYRAGDTLTAIWDNTTAGDHNAGITAVTIDFSRLGGPAAAPATVRADTWTAAYAIPPGTIDAVGCSVSVTASNRWGTVTASGTAATSVDSELPALAALTPVSNSVGTPLGTSLVITFTEGVRKGAGSVVIRNSADDSLAATIAVAGDQVAVAGTQVTVDLPSPLAEVTRFYVTVDAGAFDDLAGNPFAGISGPGDWAFTTAAIANLDVDGNGLPDALTDGILILRYLFDPVGPWSYGDALGSGATRTIQPTITSYLDGGRNTVLDVDGNGLPDALTDGILILRYLFDPAGPWSCIDALGSDATRTTRAAIKEYLDRYWAAGRSIVTGDCAVLGSDLPTESPATQTPPAAAPAGVADAVPVLPSPSPREAVPARAVLLSARTDVGSAVAAIPACDAVLVRWEPAAPGQPYPGWDGKAGFEEENWRSGLGQPRRQSWPGWLGGDERRFSLERDGLADCCFSSDESDLAGSARSD